ncbi:MAG: class II glutamine amidotransferase [Lachnospiraceae bacterium]|nr:class II glutamine amidotransferase [Lachnospiraceae bacterium]
MCEVFGVTANRKVQLNNILRDFFSHSNEHPNGWGIATFEGNNVSIEKEAIRADKSTYLKGKLSDDVYAANLFGHIRRATVGHESYLNTHPFCTMDSSGKMWTLMHNGTIFDAPVLDSYQYIQAGATDSERVLLYIVDRVNERLNDPFDEFNDVDKFELIDSIIYELADKNKFNLLFFDGENMYVHKNVENTMYLKEENGVSFFSTKPLDDADWFEVEKNRLLVYRDGRLIYKGARHDYTYIEDPNRVKLLFLDYSNL